MILKLLAIVVWSSDQLSWTKLGVSIFVAVSLPFPFHEVVYDRNMFNAKMRTIYAKLLDWSQVKAFL